LVRQNVPGLCIMYQDGALSREKEADYFLLAEG
jgi:hypothetical protein